MNFADLYRLVNAQDFTVVPVDFVRKQIIAGHPRVGDVEFYSCSLDENVSLGHMIYDEDRSSAYGDPYDVAVIRFSSNLNRCWQRLVCCKEMMHVFDDSESRTSDSERFLVLLRQLETSPLPSDISPMVDAELNAIWMAFLLLCPKSIRDKYINGYKPRLNDGDIASALKVPRIVVSALMDDYYLRALEKLTGDSADSGKKKGSPA